MYRNHPRKTRFVFALMGLAWLVSVPMIARAQEEEKEREWEIGKWYPGLELGFNLNQAAYTKNYRGGDLNTVSWTSFLNSRLDNKLSNKVHWYNTLKLAFGQNHQQKEVDGDRVWDRPAKSNDLIDFETLFQFTLKWHVDPFVSGRFRSQFLDQTDADRRDIPLNPLVYSATAGVGRKFFDIEQRTLASRIGASFRYSVRDFFKNPAPDESMRTDTATDSGIEWVTNFRLLFAGDKLEWKSMLRVYQAIFYSGDEDFDRLAPGELAKWGIDESVSDFTTATDVEFENMITTKITKILSVSLYTLFIYDKYDNTVPPDVSDTGELLNPVDVDTAIRKAGQFKETIAIGLTFNIM